MDSTLLGPAGFTLSTEEQPTLKGPHAWTPQSLNPRAWRTYTFFSARGGINIDRYSLRKHT